MHLPHVIPPGATPAVAPKPPAPPRPAAARPGPKPGEEAGGLKILTYLRLHWLMILFCGSLLGAAGAYAAWGLLASKYESYAMLHVSSVPFAIGNSNRDQARTDFVTYVKTQLALLKSEYVLNAALRNLADCPTIKAQPNPIKYLEEELMVSWQDGSEVVRITFKGHEPADAKRIVDAVQKAFMKEVVEKEILDKKKFLQAVEEAQMDIRKIIDRQVPAAMRGPAAGGAAPAGGVPAKDGAPAPKDGPPAPLPALPGAAPLAPGAVPPPAAPGGVEPAGYERLIRMNPSLLTGKMAALQSEAEQLPLAIAAGTRRLDLLKKDMEDIRDAAVSQLTLDAVEKDIEVVVQIAKTKEIKAQYEFRRNSGNENAPGVVELRDALASYQAKLDRLRKEKAETIERERRVAAANRVAAEMRELIAQLQLKQERLDAVKALFARASRQLDDVPLPAEKGGSGIALAGHREGEVYRPEASELESTDGLYRSIIRQYYMTQMELKSPPRVRELQAGSAPTQKDVKKQVLGTVFAGLLGFGLMALGAVGFETATKRVSSLADVKGSTPMPVVGVVPGDAGNPASGTPGRRAATAEAIDKLRAYVSQTWLARGATTVAVTSPLGEEGKGFTAFGLASSLAQSGYRTLLVDFDLRTPGLHEYAGVANQNGVCELLRAELDARAAIQFLPSGLHFVPAGKWSDEARKAATGEKLESLLAKLRGPYECVVLHGHALLAAAEAVEVARRCEVVLVCARYRETTTPLLKRAAERVAAMEIPYSGVVYVGASENESLC